MDLLPEECLDIIVSYLDVVRLTRLGLSSRRLRTSCFSPRYWTNVDFSTCNGANIDEHIIKKLSQFATELQILNIQNCSLISLDSLVPLVFKFKKLELVKHDEQHRLLDETVAINRMLNNADKLVEAHKINDDANEEMKTKFDNAVRQARALLWDALFVVLANKRGSKHILKDEAYFENIAHPQETLGLVMKRLRDTEQLLQKPSKLWQNTITCKTAVKSASFVKDPRTQQVYLAFGVAGEIVLWDLNTRSIVKVFNYLDSFETVTKREAKKVHHFISVLLFKHMDRVMLFGGTSTKAVCWDYDTKKIIYEIKVPEKSSGGYLSKYYARSWDISDKGEGMILHYSGAILFNLGTGELGKYLNKPKGLAIWSTLNNGLMLTAIEDQDTNTTSMEIVNLFTEETKQLFEFNTPAFEGNDDTDEKLTMDWYEDKLIALSTTNGIRIYQVDEPNCKLVLTITPKKKPYEVKFLSRDLLLLDNDIYNVLTGTLELSLGKGSRGNQVIFSPELKLVIRVQHVGVAAIYNIETKQKIGPKPSVMPLCAISKLSDDTVLVHGNYSTFASYVNYHGRNYAKINLKDGKVLETVDTPLQVLDVSSDGKYALAQHECHSWKDRHDVIFKVFEVDTKKVVFEKKFLEGTSEATWYISPVGQFMPKHPDQVLLAHSQAGFQIFDIISGKLVKDFSGPPFDGLEDHVKISPDERFVSFKTVRSNMGCNVAVDLIERKIYSLSGHSNTADSVTFNPINPSQLVTAGCGIKVFNLPNTQHAFYVTRHLDGLVQTVRESEEIACVKFSPNGKYMAVLDPPSRGPWGLEIANTLIRVYETTNFKMVSSFDTGSHARALYWLDNERAVIGLVNGELLTLQLVVKEYFKLFEFLVPSQRKTKK